MSLEQQLRLFLFPFRFFLSVDVLVANCGVREWNSEPIGHGAILHMTRRCTKIELWETKTMKDQLERMVEICLSNNQQCPLKMRTLGIVHSVNKSAHWPSWPFIWCQASRYSALIRPQSTALMVTKIHFLALRWYWTCRLEILYLRCTPARH